MSLIQHDGCRIIRKKCGVKSVHEFGEYPSGKCFVQMIQHERVLWSEWKCVTSHIGKSGNILKIHRDLEEVIFVSFMQHKG